MKQTIKSIFAMLLVLCMVFTIVGCGEDSSTASSNDNKDFFVDETTDIENLQNNTESDTPSENEEGGNQGGSVNIDIPKENVVGGKSWKEVLASMPKKLRGTSITVYNWNPASEYTGAPTVIKEFTKQTGIEVKWQKVEFGTYFTKIPAVIASGKNIPDVVRARGPVPEYLVTYQPLSTSKYDFSDAAWDKKMMELYTVGGKAYATSLQNTHIGAVNVLFYNKSLIEKYDLEDPYKLWKKGKWDWDKYIEMCRDYKNESGNPASCGEGWYWSYLSAFDIDSAVAYNAKTNKYYNNMGDKGFLQVHQTLCKLYNEEKLFAFGQADQFNQGTRLFSIGTSIHMRRQNSYFGSLKSANDLYAVPMPAPKSVKKYNQGMSEAEAYAITKGAPNPEAVPYFLRYFLDGANYELSTYFCNKQNLEVYNWCMNQENRNFVFVYPEVIKGLDENGIMGQTSDQVKSFIDKNMGTIDKVVKEYNNTIKKITK